MQTCQLKFSDMQYRCIVSVPQMFAEFNGILGLLGVHKEKSHMASNQENEEAMHTTSCINIVKQRNYTISEMLAEESGTAGVRYGRAISCVNHEVFNWFSNP